MANFQYLRKWTLIAEGGGSGLDLSQLRCTFKVEKKDTQTPNTAEFKIYNIAHSTAGDLKKSFTKVLSSAGYESNFGLIFSGNIKGFKETKEGTETILTLEAGDGDEAYNYTVINKTLAAGATPDSIVSEVSGAMGVGVGFKSSLPSTALPRGKVFYGRPCEYMREQADNTGCTWSIQDGQILLLKRTEVAAGSAVLLSPKTGLIGLPEANEDGIKAKCLLNPMLKIGSAVEIESKYASELNGQYRLISITHTGDTRGNDWYSEFAALRINGSSVSEK